MNTKELILEEKIKELIDKGKCLLDIYDVVDCLKSDFKGLNQIEKQFHDILLKVVKEKGYEIVSTMETYPPQYQIAKKQI